MGGSSSVNSTVAVTMQKYLLSFILTGDPNAQWADDKLYWPRYNESETGNGIELVFNTTMYTQDDDLAIEKVVYWNKALWY